MKTEESAGSSLSLGSKAGDNNKNKKNKFDSRFIFAWMLAVGGYYAFDFIYMPYLAIKFGYFMVFPLFLSIFLVCWIGVYTYDLLDRDAYFIEHLSAWLVKPSENPTISKIKELVNKNQKNVFVAISIWYSPLHAYIYFRESAKDKKVKMVSSLAMGSLYCSLFWGIIIDLIMLAWEKVSKFI